MQSDHKPLQSPLRPECFVPFQGMTTMALRKLPTHNVRVAAKFRYTHGG